MSIAQATQVSPQALCASRATFQPFRRHNVLQMHRHSMPRTLSRCASRVWAADASVLAAGVDANAATALSGNARASPEVVLTREKGKNGKLLRELEMRGISCLELPLIETGSGPDREVLPSVLSSQAYDWVCLTSPEAANVFMAGWRAAGRPQGLRIAVVGEGTGEVLVEAEGDALRPQFVPSAADAVHFSAELPHVPGGADTVLYPASSKAGATLQEGLEARGFKVTRLNTYTTIPVSSISQELLQAAKGALVVTAASPSTIKSWVKFCGGPEETDVAVACIGSTSARAAEQLGISRIYYPELPGIEGFVTSIEQALTDCKRQSR